MFQNKGRGHFQISGTASSSRGFPHCTDHALGTRNELLMSWPYPQNPQRLCVLLSRSVKRLLSSLPPPVTGLVTLVYKQCFHYQEGGHLYHLSNAFLIDWGWPCFYLNHLSLQLDFKCPKNFLCFVLRRRKCVQLYTHWLFYVNRLNCITLRLTITLQRSNHSNERVAFSFNLLPLVRPTLFFDVNEKKIVFFFATDSGKIVLTQFSSHQTRPLKF